MSDVVDGARSRQGIAVGGSLNHTGETSTCKSPGSVWISPRTFSGSWYYSIEKVVDPTFPIYSHKVHEEFYLYGTVERRPPTRWNA